MDHFLLQSTPFGLACWWWWLWTLGAILLGWLLNWLLNRGKQTIIDNLTAERDRYHALATKWEKDYNTLKYQLEEAQKSEVDLRASLQRCEADRQTLNYKLSLVKDPGETSDPGILGVADLGDGPVVYDDDNDAYGSLFTNDNLQIIEGVGPKIESVLHDAGFANWDAVAAVTPEALKAALDAAGKSFQLADPSSWPHQAKLAAAGQWDELIQYQKFTDGGRETTGDFESDSKFEKLAAKKLGFASMDPNDLKVVEGIGPKIESLFKEAGIMTWRQLAATSVTRMQEILDAAGDSYRLAVPGSWAQQATLAAEGKWDQLSKLQKELRAGK